MNAFSRLPLIVGGVIFAQVAQAQVLVPRELVLNTSHPVPVSGSVTGAEAWASGSGSALQSTPASIDANGNIAFSAILASGIGGVTGANNFTYWYGGPGSLSLVTRYGDATLDNANCGGPGAVFTARQTPRVSISPGGHMWIGGTATGGTLTTDNRFIWTGQQGSFSKCLQNLDILTTLDAGTAQLSSAPDSANASNSFMNNLGHVTLVTTLAPNVGDTLGDASNNAAAFVGGPGAANLTKIVRKGDPLTGGVGELFQGFSPVGLNHSDHVLLSCALRSGVAGVVNTNDELLMGRFGASLTIIAREGASTGLAGLTYGTAAGSFPVFTPGRQALNNSDRVVFIAPLAGAVTGATNAAIMTWSAGVTSIVARKGDVVPGAGGATITSFQANPSSSDFALNNSNQVIWTGKLLADGVNVFFTNDSILAVTTIGVGTSLIVREGDQVPGMDAGVVWGASANVATNASGMVVFQNSLTGTGITAGVNDWSYWLFSPAGGGKFRLLGRAGDLMDGVTVSTVTAPLDPNGEGSSVGINDANWLTFSAWGSGGLNTGLVYRSRVCPADLTGPTEGVPDAAVDINDLLYFLASFEAGSLGADVDNGSGTGMPDSAVDINDLLYFLARFEAGC